MREQQSAVASDRLMPPPQNSAVSECNHALTGSCLFVCLFYDALSCLH